MKKYLFFASGNLTDSLVSEIINSISDITTTFYLKYKLQSNFMIIHFGSDIEYFNIQDFVTKSMRKKNIIYFLTERTDNLSSNFKDEEMADFLILDGNLEEGVIDDLSDEEKRLILELQEKFFSGFVEYVQNDTTDEEKDLLESKLDEILNKHDKTKSSQKEYSLDDILDKINEKGINSLSKEEKEYLNNLSK